MNRSALRVSASCLLLLLGIGCSNLSRVDFGRLVTSGRDGWQHPEQVIDSLELSPGDRVAEIGAGNGYWLPWLSEAVGPTGRVYAVEVEVDLVTELENRVEDEGLHNVTVVFGDFDDPKLPEQGVDLAFTCLTYHHIDDRVPYFARLRRDLSPRGRLAHIDDRPDVGAPISWFQGDGHWSDLAAIEDEMRQAGYRRTATFDFLPAQSFQLFVPVESDAGVDLSEAADFGESHLGSNETAMNGEGP